MTERSNIDTPKNLAARAGRWSAQHRKKAIFGWLAFVILAVFIGGSIGTKTLSDNDSGIGESGRADKAVSDHFPDKDSESVLIQSQNGARNDGPEFRKVVASVVTSLEGTKHVRKVESPYAEGNDGTLSADGKSALVTLRKDLDLVAYRDVIRLRTARLSNAVMYR